MKRSELNQIMKEAGRFPAFKTAAGKLSAFVDLIEELREREKSMELPDFYDLVCEKTGYIDALKEKKDMESRARIENVRGRVPRPEPKSKL